ncbi:redox-regulated ATPase YchF [Patescibacteria group bacterium]|nr:redox-regulated ATPase YchF [Patescibacteria group bacterium]
MNLSIGIVGLPNVGKSTLFNALLKKQAALVANYPFATIEPNVGVVEVPDERLQGLAEVVRADFGGRLGEREVPQKIIPATVKFYDIAGLVKGAHQGEGLGNEFLGHIREVDALVHVLRDFDDEMVVRAGSISPQEDKTTIETELILSDLSMLERMLRTANDEAKTGQAEAVLRRSVLVKLAEVLNSGQAASTVELGEKEEKALRGINLLTRKPMIYVFNVSEDKLSNIAVQSESETRSNELSISAKIESELCSLSETEQQDFLTALGLKESGLNRLIRAGYQVLGLQSFLTAGPKEVRAWTIKQQASAPEAAGVIHSDFERGFIGADVIAYPDLMAAGSFKKAKEQGLIRLEGRNYTMQDGDVVEFRFNV